MVFLPPNCVNGDGLTLDDMTLPQLREETGVDLTVGQYDLGSSFRAFLEDFQVVLRGEGRQLSELGYYLGRKR